MEAGSCQQFPKTEMSCASRHLCETDPSCDLVAQIVRMALDLYITMEFEGPCGPSTKRFTFAVVQCNLTTRCSTPVLDGLQRLREAFTSLPA